jgi:hypothetical protein
VTLIVRSAQSLEFVTATIATENVETGETVDPTGDAVALAFVSEGASLTASTPFVTAAWVTNAEDPDNPVYMAQVLAGPGADYVPEAGTVIDVWARVTDNPEVPKILSGSIKFV